MKEALFYNKEENGSVRCYLCSHNCSISEGKFGFCGVRQNKAGKLYTYTYAHPIALNIDPIEKKPLYQFLPGSRSFSLATLGCNFRCGFCQNWSISQKNYSGGVSAREDEVMPQEIIEQAVINNCRSISYTYTEPTIFFEYALDIAKLAKAKGLYNVFVTNGYMSRQCIEVIKPYLDAANVDLKFFRESAYRNICASSLKPVLDSIRLMHELGIWVEITTLIVPGENDSEGELKQIADFIASVSCDIPWHLSRFHPDYRFKNYDSTPEVTIKVAIDIGKAAGLRFVYAGNVLGFGNDTSCYSCGKLLVKREGFDILENNIRDGKCRYCNSVMSGVY